MCGRYFLILTLDDLIEIFGVEKNGFLEPRYNIAPSQSVPAIRQEETGRRLVMLRWGLIPPWAKDTKIGYRTINARSETAATLPSFRSAFRQRRCLIPALGFFEWDKQSGSRQPYQIRRRDDRPMAFAGLWERWQNPQDQAVIESCTILTTKANEEVSRIHDRMPVILEPSGFSLWLDPDEHRPEKLQPLLRPVEDGQLALKPVSTYVNSPRNEGEKCLEPVGEKP
ncbi:MAG: SOS response-associated peptidase [Desulfuromonadaceae bacterium]|nr:SOS response-associated peptidase [Desulfuromonadaceae bacterium]